MAVKSCLLLVLVSAIQPLMVLAFTKCEKIDECRCSTDQGELSLWSLAESAENAPRCVKLLSVLVL